MLNTTRVIIQSAIKGDATLDEAEQNQMIQALTACIDGKQGTPLQMPRVISRKEAAQILGKTRGRVDQLARAGLLVKVYGVGTTRALGYSESSVKNLAEGRIERGC